MVRFHSAATLNDTTAQGRAMSITYRPPEVDVKINPKNSQAYDVWSLACVLFQFMVWHLFGYDAVHDEQRFLNAQHQWCQSFKRARINNDNAQGWAAREDKFFNIRFDESSRRLVAEVKESVEQWARLLHSSQYCSQAIHDLLELVMTRMFIIEPSKRIGMSEVKSAISGIVGKCSISDDYYRKGVPRTGLNVDSGSLEFVKTMPEDSSTSSSTSTDDGIYDASRSFENLTELFGVTSEADEATSQPQIISGNTTPIRRLPALIDVLDGINNKLGQNHQQTETSLLRDPVPPASLAEIQAAAGKSSLIASSSRSRMSVPTTVATSYLQTPSDLSSIRHTSYSTPRNTDTSLADQKDPLWLSSGEFLDAHNRSQSRLEYDSHFDISETDIRNIDTTSNASVEGNEDRISIVRPVSLTHAERSCVSNSGRTRESRGWKQRIGIRIHKLSEHLQWHRIFRKVKGWKS
ncbi:putative serine threonine protein kinase [Rosellinia necatrix]|uniref:Putative serine threonine protein kinase n=1 Tax=Rosellinia necatrix TaxID=77044 RepID=A0A1W2TXJ2_ROSNE|nr:putative serine threonine protein kinase [Rosellinia necatrix]